MIEPHPVLWSRIVAFLNDPEIKQYGLTINNIGRTFAQQVYLWEGYQARLEWARRHPHLSSWLNPYKHFNLAANPYAVGAGAYDVKNVRGSWHNPQFSEEYKRDLAYAVDFNWSLLPNWFKPRARQIAAKYMLIPTVASEDWHYQMTWDNWHWEPERKEWDEMASKEEIKQIVEEAIAKRDKRMEGRVDYLYYAWSRGQFPDGVSSAGRTTPLAKLERVHYEMTSEEGRTFRNVIEATNAFIKKLVRFHKSGNKEELT